MWQQRKLCADKPLERVSAQVQDAQAFVAEEGVGRQRLDLIVAQVHFDEDDEVAESVRMDLTYARLAQKHTLQIHQTGVPEHVLLEQRYGVAG